MAEVLVAHDTHLRELAENIQKALESLPRSNRNQQQCESDCAHIMLRMKEFRNTLDAAQLELKQMSRTSSGRCAQLTTAFRQHKDKLKDLQAICDTHKNTIQRQALFEGASTNEPDRNNTQTELMEHGEFVMNASHASLKRSAERIYAAREMGTETVNKLETQKDKLASVHDRIEEIDTTMARSLNALRRIGRRIATDKLVWACTCLVIVCIVVVLIVISLRRKH